MVGPEHKSKKVVFNVALEHLGPLILLIFVFCLTHFKSQIFCLYYQWLYHLEPQFHRCAHL